MSPYIITNAEAWQESWDRQQEAYLPDREHRIAAMLDVVAAVAADPPPEAGAARGSARGVVDRPVRLLDLTGGTGSITLRALARFRRVEATVLDLDPVLLAIARASLQDAGAAAEGPASSQAARSQAAHGSRGRATVVTADLNRPDWVAALPHREFDAVLAATALHWLHPDRLATLYGEIREVLRPGGVLVNADHMPDGALPTLTKRLTAAAEARRDARYAAGAVVSWDAWWQWVAADPTLAPLVAKRTEVYPGDHSAEWMPPAAWHLDALRAAGYTETGLVWRGGTDAAVAGLR